MEFEEFQKTLSANSPPAEIPDYLKALWYDAKGDWQKAHQIVQNIDDSTAAWIHAYLHRKEGDIGNADYWYRRAGADRPFDSLENEWENIAKKLL